MSKTGKRLVIISMLLLVGFALRAQDGAYGGYSPYSVYGIGNLSTQGNAYTKGMGGIGIATRNNRYINVVNPAAITARDTLSFMADFGMESQNTLFRQGKFTSASNTFNVSDLAVTFPIYRKSAFSFGLSNFSTMGYSFSHKEIDETGIWTSTSAGNGGMYQIFAGAAATFFGRLSVGAQGIYYFGDLDKPTSIYNSNSTYRNFSRGYIIDLKGFTGKLGVQYEMPLSNGTRLTLGGTYRFRTRLHGNVTDYSFANISSYQDTIYYKVHPGRQVGIADEIGAGVSLRRGEKWMVELNYTRSDWAGTGMDTNTGFANIGQSKFSATASQSIRAGFEFVPNRNDIRYYLRRCSYRGGLYFDQAYYKLDGSNVNAIGLTFGVTLPVFRWYNGVSLGVDIGQKGGTRGMMTRERYAKFVIGFNIHDIWFRKPQYE